jgi:hypothetical protein
VKVGVEGGRKWPGLLEWVGNIVCDHLADKKRSARQREY